MSSILVGELKNILEQYPDDYEVMMSIRHKYDIPKEDGIKGWMAYINAIDVNPDSREIKLMN